MSLILYALTLLVLVGYFRSYLLDKDLTVKSAKYSINMLEHIFPYLAAGLWITGLFFAFIPDETISYVLDDKNTPLMIPVVCLLAMIFPGPRYIIYPLAAGLALKGVNIGIVVSYLTADVLIDPSCVFLEAKMLGKRYYIYRFALALMISCLGGYISYMFIPNSIMFS
jgi:uncharacterized membrane protein YraQ (UPF0718 family)